MANFKDTCREIIFGTENSSRSQVRFWFYGISLFVFLCIVCGVKALACSPPEPGQLELDVKNSKNIVLARVVSKTEVKPSNASKRYRYKLEVVKNLKGTMKSFALDLDIDEGGNCGVELQVGSIYLNCLGTKPYFGGCGGFYPNDDETDPTFVEVKKILDKKSPKSKS